MQFIITAYDGTDEKALERRMNARPRHLENMQKVKERGKVVCAGGLLNEEGKMKGSFLVLEFENRQMLDEYLESEPYVIEKVWEKVQVETCNVVILGGEKVGQ